MMLKRVGIVGAGKIVENAHLPVLTVLPEAKACWITDQSASRAQSLSAMYDLPWIDIDKVGDAISQIDILLLAIPWGARAPYIELAAKARKALYVEKPFARSLSEHLAIESTFPPGSLAAGFQRRLYSSILATKRTIEDQLFGKLRKIKLVACEFDLKSGGGSSFITRPDQAGGGVLIESAIHFLDQIVYVTKATAIQVHRVKAIVIGKIDYEVRCDCSIITAVKDSIPVDIIASRLRNQPFEFEFTFDQASLAIPREPGSRVRVAEAPDRVAATEALKRAYANTTEVNAVDKAFFEFWRLFLEGMDRESPNATSASTSRTTSAWLEAIYNRIETGLPMNGCSE